MTDNIGEDRGYVTMSPNQPLLHPNQSPIEEYQVQQKTKTGCCYFSNNFYLTVSFAFVFAVICIFQILFVILFGYMIPTCGCSDFWKHLLVLPTNMKLIYTILILYLFSFSILGFMCLRGLLCEVKQKVIPFLVILSFTEIALVLGVIIGVTKGSEAFKAKMEEVEITEDFIEETFNMFVYEKYAKAFASMFTISNIGFNGINAEEIINEVFREEVIVQMDAIKTMVIFSGAVIGAGFQMLLLSTIFLLIKVVHRMSEFEKFLIESRMVPVAANGQGSTYKLYPTPSPNGNNGIYRPTGSVNKNMNYAGSIASKNEEVLIIPGKSGIVES